MLPRSTTTGPASPRAPLDLSANYVPMQRSRAAYTPQPNPPTEKRMNSGNPSSSHVYPSPPHEDFHPPRQVIRLEYSPRENGQTQYYGFQNSGASYVEASYQPPPPVQASYQPPPSAQMTQNNARRALPVPGKAARALSAKAALATFPPPPSYPPPVPSPTSAISHFLPSPSTSPPQSILPIQPSSRSHSPTSTELPEYSSARSYASVQIGRPPLQIAINTASPTQPARPEYAQYLETTSYPSPHTSQATSSLLRIPESPAQYISTSAPTDNERKPWYTRGNRSSAPSSPRIALASPQAPESSSGSSNSSSGGLSTPTLPSPTFVFPGSRSVARPKASKVDSRSKSRKMKDSIGKSPISDFPHAIPPLPTAPSAVRLPNSNTTTVPSAGSTNPVNVLPGFPDTTHSETSSVFSNELDIARARKISGSSGNTSPVYVFPVGRSRAQPKLVPNGSKGQRSGKFSGSTSSGENEEKRTGFMGKLLKKKTKTPKSVEESNTISTGSSVESGPTKEATTPANENKPESYQVMQANMNEESRAQAKRTKSRIGNYPLDPYDSVLLDKYVSMIFVTPIPHLRSSTSLLLSDRHTGELLVRLNPTGSPSFHNYGNNPPTSVLDLGCGQGCVMFLHAPYCLVHPFCRHWVVDAAIAWKGYGTKVTGYDMVDVSKGLLPWAAEQGVIANIRFVRGNL